MAEEFSLVKLVEVHPKPFSHSKSVLHVAFYVSCFWHVVEKGQVEATRQASPALHS